jgi:hypothetical protein
VPPRIQDVQLLDTARTALANPDGSPKRPRPHALVRERHLQAHGVQAQILLAHACAGAAAELVRKARPAGIFQVQRLEAELVFLRHEAQRPPRSSFGSIQPERIAVLESERQLVHRRQFRRRAVIGDHPGEHLPAAAKRAVVHRFQLAHETRLFE